MITFGPLWGSVGRSGSRMLLTGAFSRAIDEKQRIAIPKRIREELLRGDGNSLFIAPGTDGSLALYTEEIFATMAARLTVASPAEQDVRAFSRLFYSQAQRVEFDTQGRLRIPVELARLAEARARGDLAWGVRSSGNLGSSAMGALSRRASESIRRNRRSSLSSNLSFDRSVRPLFRPLRGSPQKAVGHGLSADRGSGARESLGCESGLSRHLA